MRELIDRQNVFCEDKIFEILDNDHPEKRFKFVHLKVKNIKDRSNQSANPNDTKSDAKFKTLVQIIDMSDKMLYNESKAE